MLNAVYVVPLHIRKMLLPVQTLIYNEFQQEEQTVKMFLASLRRDTVLELETAYQYLNFNPFPFLPPLVTYDSESFLCCNMVFG